MGRIQGHFYFFLFFKAYIQLFDYQEEDENKPCSWNEYIMWGINYLSDISKKYWNEVLSLETQHKELMRFQKTPKETC